ncbi:hypothetical protein AB1Y20_021938 [Prymnesium parvum]|uniref:Uncharacterized protein n=1 Tax=Prymnesium parvum TaxID=97485 RepID=A0AB34JHC7_PRYPA
MPAARVLLLAVGYATALRLPSAGSTASARPTSTRREILPVVTSAAAALFAVRVSAYDTLPTVDPDFEKIERLRLEREAATKKKTQQVLSFVKAIEAARTKDEFITAADKFAIFIIGEGKFPEGLKVKELVKRITEAYESLPKERYYCEETRTNQGICYTPGKDAEAAYEALIKEVRQYSLIQLGDYRTVTFKAF